VRFAGGGDGRERDVFLSMHWNNIGFNEVKTDAKNGAKPGGWGAVVDIEMGVGEGVSVCRRRHRFLSITLKSHATSMSK
jgi:hypothetical protein